MGFAERCDPETGRHPHRQGRHQRRDRILRRRCDGALGHRQSHDLQHGRRSGRHLFALPLRRGDGTLPAGDGPRRSGRRCERARRQPAGRRRGSRRSRKVLRPRNRDRPFGARTLYQRSVHARRCAHDLRIRRLRPRKGYPAADGGRPGGFLHELLVPGHGPRRFGGAPGQNQRFESESGVHHQPGLGAGSLHGRARRHPGGPDRHRRRDHGQRMRPLHRAVGPPHRRPDAPELDRHVVQPQLRKTRRRQPQHARLRRVARTGDGTYDRGRPDFQPAHRHAHERKGRTRAPRPAAGRRAAAPGLRREG